MTSGAEIVALVSGALTMGYVVLSLFFYKFWKRTRDRLFAMFSLAFLLLGVQRVGVVISVNWLESLTWLYVIRLLAFILILAAIIDKNASRTSR